MNRKSKFISILVILALVLSSTGMVFADSDDPGLKESAAKKALTVESPLPTISFNSLTMPLASVSPAISIPTTSTEAQMKTVKPSAVYYTDSDALTPIGTTSPGTNTIGVKSGNKYMTKGTLIIDMLNDTSSSDWVYCSVHNAANNAQVGSIYATPNGIVKSATIPITTAGNYYLRLSSYSYSVTGKSYSSAIQAAFIPGANKTNLSNNVPIIVGQTAAQTDQFTFKAVNTGYIQVATNESCDVTLCNSSGKALSKADWLYPSGSKYPVYGVTKGKSYIINTKMSSNYDGFYAINVKNTKIATKGASKKSKAKTLKKKKTLKGTVTAGSSRVNWYKFKLNSTKNPVFTFKGNANDKIMIKVYKGKKLVTGGTVTLSAYNNGGTYKAYGDWTKGTYYIKVYRGNKYSSGYYSVKWK